MARVRTDFDHRVEMRDHVLIPVADGTRLSARIWLPEDAESHPVPAILEYIPYRKRDGTVVRDTGMHPYVAGHGYATVRVDMRGSGDSEGVLTDEYLQLEIDDGVDVVAWLASQPWCTGRVGMIGKSWGGFNGLQIAAMNPPALGGIITVCSTDDRYADDVHYMGGTVLASKMLAWASTMFSMNALPPDPDVVGDSWREMWMERLEHSPPFIEEWMEHQTRDSYWQHGSVCEDYTAITCPVFAVGGWADGYSNAVLRLLAGLSGMRRGLIGPWGHQYPQSGVPGPAIGFLQECVRWWDHCLKGVANGIDDEPMLRAWMMDWVPPGDDAEYRPGRWVAEDSWPGSPGERVMYLDDERLVDDPGPGQTFVIEDHLVGVDGGDWCPTGSTSDMPTDQRSDDGISASYDSETLDAPIDILGFPKLTVRLSSDRPFGQLGVRLCDVAPDGSSLLVTRGVLNLTHHKSHQDPKPLGPGEEFTATVRLNAIGYVFPIGHRIRLALSANYWPWLWPTREIARLTVRTGEVTSLRLPVRVPRAGDATLPPFGEPEISQTAPAIQHVPTQAVRTISHDEETGRITVDKVADNVTSLPDIGIEKSRHRVERVSLIVGQPLSCVATTTSTTTLRRGDWQIRIDARTSMESDLVEFSGTNSIEVFEGGAQVYSSSTSWATPRRD